MNNDFKGILNLRTNESIGKALAERQMQVICSAYHYLSQAENNLIYIADEVGLGKTYIAAGIAMLLRHFSLNISDHKDVIIVPKKNLQVKWQKELNNFIKNNYLDDNDKIKDQYTNQYMIKDRIYPVEEKDAITIFRMSSFSAVGMVRQRKETLTYLIEDIFNNNELAKEVLYEAYNQRFFNQNNQSSLRKIIGYLFNALSPKISCLIVDEAHNYKHGLGSEDHDNAIRNEVTARFLGAVNDATLLAGFPQLKKRIKFPLAEKIICLSATPKDRSLLEIRNQLDCFTNKHILANCKKPEDVKEQLKRFLIRGNMEYQIKSETVSRNQGRFEHRNGNVNKNLEPEIITVKDGFESVFWQLLQYKSIKHLELNNNASFEMGMLAGFETYQLDCDKKRVEKHKNGVKQEHEQKEYEQTAHRHQKESQDHNVIKKLIESYLETFKNEPPPHPKMDRLENELLQQVERQEKSLIFVRRIATAYELEKRLLARYQKNIVVGKHLNFTGRFKKYRTKEVEDLLNQYQDYEYLLKSEDVFHVLLNRNEIRSTVAELVNSTNVAEEGIARLSYAYQNNTLFAEEVNKYIQFKRQNVSSEFRQITIAALLDSDKPYKEELVEDDDNSDVDKTLDGYFFSDYFKKGMRGFRYKTKFYRENWFDLNIYLLNYYFQFLSFDDLELKEMVNNWRKDKRKHQNFLKFQNEFADYIQQKGRISTNIHRQEHSCEELKENTCLTDIFTTLLISEFEVWLQKRLERDNMSALLQDLYLLNTIVKTIFRNGSGLIAGFVADAYEDDFSVSLIDLIRNNDAPFHFVLKELKTILKDFDLIIAVNFPDRNPEKISSILQQQVPVVGTTGIDKIDRGDLAARFRMPGYPYVLVTTDIFREGEDLHTYCQNVYHYGIAWNPSEMEQRTGRIDRINSMSYRVLNEMNELTFENMIQVFYPYIANSVEVNQLVRVLENINKFIETFNDLDKNNNYQSTVAINEMIEKSDIPPQIKSRLKALYDIDNFVSMERSVETGISIER